MRAFGTTSSGIRHVLFDADGVLQDIPGGWYAALEPYVGDKAREFLHQTWKDELPTLAGDGDYLPMLADILRRYNVQADVNVVFADVWHRIDVNEESIQLVQALRAVGYGVHLATNQERHRGEFMKNNLGYDRWFDVQCYSYDLGVAKPDPAFFIEAVRRINAPPETILFIDDTKGNIEAALTTGMRAQHWRLSDGHRSLLDVLAAHDINLGVEVADAQARSRLPADLE